MLHRLFSVVLLLAVICQASAAPPPEMASLQQAYSFAFAERVTTPYEAGIETLNANYATALNTAAAAAKKDGRLTDLIALEEEQKRLVEKKLAPATDDDKIPEVLNKLRGIYHAQETKVAEQRSANLNTLLPAYVDKLKTLEATLTKADRVAEAKEVLSYRESLKADVPPPAPATAIASTGASATKPAMSVAKDDSKLPKADEHQAAECVRPGAALRAGGADGLDGARDLAPQQRPDNVEQQEVLHEDH